MNATRKKLSDMCSLADYDLLNMNVPSAAEQPKTKSEGYLLDRLWIYRPFFVTGKRGKYKMTGKYKRRKIAAASEVLDEVE
jgi:hypothetical protein